MQDEVLRCKQSTSYIKQKSFIIEFERFLMISSLIGSHLISFEYKTKTIFNKISSNIVKLIVLANDKEKKTEKKRWWIPFNLIKIKCTLKQNKKNCFFLFLFLLSLNK